MRRGPISPTRVLVAILALVGLFASACGDGEVASTDPTPTADPAPTAMPAPDPTPEPTTEPTPEPTTEPTAEPTADPTATSEPAATPEPTVTPMPEQNVVRVYWFRDTGIAVGGRLVDTPMLAARAMEELLAGPNTLETELGMVSGIPAGTEVLGLAVADGVATIDLSSEFETTGLGTTGEIALVSQVVFTLTQFPTVDTVNIWIEGEEREAILSHGLLATDLTRQGFLDAVAPAIVIESPYPGELVTSPLVVTGFSRTFEATVVYVVTIPPSDEIVDEGFTTAAQPDVDKFGPWDFTVNFDPEVAGFGAIIAFEESAQDGSQINIYEVPVRMES